MDVGRLRSESRFVQPQLHLPFPRRFPLLAFSLAMSATLLTRRSLQTSLRTPSRQIFFRAYAVASSPSPSPVASSSTTPSSSALPPPSDYDVVIIGGGVAGLTLAAALGELSLCTFYSSCDLARELNRTLPPPRFSSHDVPPQDVPHRSVRSVKDRSLETQRWRME